MFKQRKYKLGKEVKNMHLKEKIATIIQGQRTGVLSTVRNEKPHSAFMMFFHEDFVLYVATDRQSKKITDIEQNPNVHVLLGREGKKLDEDYIEVEGLASIEEDSTLKNKFWNNSLKRWLLGPEDPNYVLIKINPDTIYYIDGAGTTEPEFLRL
ncbi:General stress protein 26 [Bacillus cereus ATCC 10876]|nr:General stress protein 26 [Bacillus thuringiensis serovar israelensis ATCC 35646]EEK52652.1 General stress protein 26 [Bacillus cereus ATCC 10876]EEN04965.1 General stress protein 26 [Bacillus thuringiensis IBL 4222]